MSASRLAGWYMFIGFLMQSSVEADWGGLTNSTSPGLPRAPDGLKNGVYWTPGILQTLALVMLNALNWEAVTDDGGLGDDGVSTKAKERTNCLPCTPPTNLPQPVKSRINPKPLACLLAGLGHVLLCRHVHFGRRRHLDPRRQRARGA